MTKFRNFSNSIIKFLIIFTITFFWLNYFFRNGIISFFISSLISFIIYALINFFEKKRNIRKNLTKEDLKKIEEIKTQLFFNSNKENNLYLQKLLNLNKNMELDLGNTKYHVLQYLTIQEINANNISQIYNKAKTKKLNNIIIICNSINNENKQIFQDIINIKFHIITIDYLYYNFIKEKNLYPQKTIEISQKSKYKFKELLNIALKKENQFKFMKLGFLTFFLSLFTIFKIYYIILGSIMFLLSLICRIRKIEKNNNNINFKKEP